MNNSPNTNPSTQQHTNYSLNLFDQQQQFPSVQQQQLSNTMNTMNNVSIPSPLIPRNANITSPNSNSSSSLHNDPNLHYAPHNTAIPAFSQIAQMHSSNNNAHGNIYSANMRNNNNLHPHSQQAAQPQPTAAVLQEFAKQNQRKNGYSPNNNNMNNMNDGDNTMGAGGRMLISPNSSSSNLKQPTFDYKALSKRLREQYNSQLLIWNETSPNNAQKFEQLDRPLVEALLLPKHRPQILAYEEKIIQFLMSDEWTYRFPANFSSFNRLLLHRLSETFKLDHQVDYVSNPRDMDKHHRTNRSDDQNKAVVITKMENTRFADIQLSQIDVKSLTEFHIQRLTDSEREEWEEKKSRYSMSYNPNLNNHHLQSNGHNPHHNVHQQQNRFQPRYRKKNDGPNNMQNMPNDVVPLNPQNMNNNDDGPNVDDGAPQTSPLVMDAMAQEPQFDENEGQQQPVRLLLKKDNMMNGGAGNMSDKVQKYLYGHNKNKSSLKLENKQEKYNKMKEKIFSGVASPKALDLDHNKKDICAVEMKQNENVDDEEVKQSLDGIEEDEMGKEGQPDAQLQDCIQQEQKANDPQCESKQNDDEEQQQEGQLSTTNNEDAAANANNNTDCGIKKKFGKKGGWVLVKEKRIKDVNTIELFKKSKQRLQALCSSKPKKDKEKILRASILQKTLEEKRRSSGTFKSIYDKWGTDDINGSFTNAEKQQKFSTHSLIPSLDTKKPSLQMQTNGLTAKIVNEFNPESVPTNLQATRNDFNPNDHDRNKTPLVASVADTQSVRNHFTVNAYKPGATTEAIKNLLDGAKDNNVVVNGNTNVVNSLYPNNAINGIQAQNTTNYGITGQAQTIQYIQTQPNGAGIATSYVVPGQAAAATVNNAAAQFYSGIPGVVAQQTQPQIQTQVAAAQQPANLYELYLRQQQQQQQHVQHTQQQHQPQQQQQQVVVPDQTTQQQLATQKSQCLSAISQYNQLIQYFQNAGALSVEQQTYLNNLLQNVAMQQQLLQRIQCAESVLMLQQDHNQVQKAHDAAQQQAERERLLLQQQIDHHKAVHTQLLQSQQIVQNEQVRFNQQLSLHTLQYQQAQQTGNQNAMYVSTLQMQQDQQLQQQATAKYNGIAQQLAQVGQNLHILQQQQQQLLVQHAQQQAQRQQQQQQLNALNMNAQNNNMNNNLSNMNNMNNNMTPDGHHSSQPNTNEMQQSSQPNEGSNTTPGQSMLYSFQAQNGANNAAQNGVVDAQNNTAKQQMPNPTVNALILHTGNSAGNVNINIYADGQSGQNTTNSNNQSQNNNTLSNNQSANNMQQQQRKNNKNDRNRRFVQMSNLYGNQQKNKTSGATQDAHTSPSNSSENESAEQAQHEPPQQAQSALPLNNASSNSSSVSSGGDAAGHEALDMVHDIAVGPRHSRTNRPSPPAKHAAANQNKFNSRNNNEDKGGQNNQNNAASPQQANNVQQKNETNAQTNNNQKGGNNMQQNNKQQQQQQQQQVQHHSHHNNQSNQSRNNQNNNNRMRDGNQQNNSFNSRSRNNSFNRNMNNNNNNNTGTNSSNSSLHSSGSQNNNSGNNNQRGGGRGSGWTSDITPWMADWFFSRDQDTKSSILRLQKTLRCGNKPKKPERTPPNPPDVFSADSRNNPNRYRNNSNRRRGNYHNQRGNRNYGNSRGYGRNNYNNNRFNNNNSSAQNNDHGHGHNNNQSMNNNQRNNNMGGGNRSYSRNRRNYRHNRSQHMRGHNSQQNVNNNSSQNNNHNQNNNRNQHQQPHNIMLQQQQQQNMQQQMQMNNNRNNNNNLQRMQQSQMQQRSQNNNSSSSSFAQKTNMNSNNNMMNNNASNVAQNA